MSDFSAIEARVIAWLYPFYNQHNELDFRLFPGYEVLPFWGDAAHTELDSAIRLYPVEVYVGAEKKIIQKADIFMPDGVGYIPRSQGAQL